MCLNIRENPENCPHMYSVHINYLQIYMHMNEICTYCFSHLTKKKKKKNVPVVDKSNPTAWWRGADRRNGEEESITGMVAPTLHTQPYNDDRVTLGPSVRWWKWEETADTGSPPHWLKKTLICNPAPYSSDLAWEWATVCAFSVIFHVWGKVRRSGGRTGYSNEPWGLLLTTISICSYGCTLSDGCVSHPIYQTEPDMPIFWQIEFIIAFWSIVIFSVYF